jgi:rubrerythrin
LVPGVLSPARLALAVLTILPFAGADVFAGDPSPRYPETMAVLSGVYQGEVRARLAYDACALRAAREGYPNIAYLFSTLSTSETIHSSNFRRILSSLGMEAEEPPAEDLAVRKTRENLKTACDRELEEIDRKYPAMLERMQPEGHEESVRFLTYAWKSEKQHRDLLKEIESGTGFFFGTLVQRIEGEPLSFLVCANCGSTVSERPKDRCPVCGGPPSGYEELKKTP